jgi:hypothetical protein
MGGVHGSLRAGEDVLFSSSSALNHRQWLFLVTALRFFLNRAAE